MAMSYQQRFFERLIENLMPACKLLFDIRFGRSLRPVGVFRSVARSGKTCLIALRVRKKRTSPLLGNIVACFIFPTVPTAIYEPHSLKGSGEASYFSARSLSVLDRLARDYRNLSETLQEQALRAFFLIAPRVRPGAAENRYPP